MFRLIVLFELCNIPSDNKRPTQLHQYICSCEFGRFESIDCESLKRHHTFHFHIIDRAKFDNLSPGKTAAAAIHLQKTKIPAIKQLIPFICMHSNKG